MDNESIKIKIQDQDEISVTEKSNKNESQETFAFTVNFNVNDEFEAVRLETNESIENTATEIKSLIYPVGSVYIADSVNINPATIFGGEWELFDKEFESSSDIYDKIKLGILYIETGEFRKGVNILDEICLQEPDLLITPALQQYIKQIVNEKL